MLEKLPSQAEMIDLVGQPLFEVWQALCSAAGPRPETKPAGHSIGNLKTYNWNLRPAGMMMVMPGHSRAQAEHGRAAGGKRA